MIDETEYMTAKIYSLSGQPKFRGTGAKREYNTFFDYARIELLHFLDQVANLRSNKKAVIIARTFRKMMSDEEEEKKKYNKEKKNALSKHEDKNYQWSSC